MRLRCACGGPGLRAGSARCAARGGWVGGSRGCGRRGGGALAPAHGPRPGLGGRRMPPPPDPEPAAHPASPCSAAPLSGLPPPRSAPGAGPRSVAAAPSPPGSAAAPGTAAAAAAPPGAPAPAAPAPAVPPPGGGGLKQQSMPAARGAHRGARRRAAPRRTAGLGVSVRAARRAPRRAGRAAARRRTRGTTGRDPGAVLELWPRGPRPVLAPAACGGGGAASQWSDRWRGQKVPGDTVLVRFRLCDATTWRGMPRDAACRGRVPGLPPRQAFPGDPVPLGDQGHRTIHRLPRPVPPGQRRPRPAADPPAPPSLAAVPRPIGTPWTRTASSSTCWRTGVSEATWRPSPPRHPSPPGELRGRNEGGRGRQRSAARSHPPASGRAARRAVALRPAPHRRRPPPPRAARTHGRAPLSAPARRPPPLQRAQTCGCPRRRRRHRRHRFALSQLRADLERSSSSVEEVCPPAGAGRPRAAAPALATARRAQQRLTCRRGRSRPRRWPPRRTPSPAARRAPSARRSASARHAR
jgi:hypothetical protein